MMRPVRFLHTSDVHLGSGGFPRPDHGDHLDECLCPLDAIEAAVADQRPDAVLVVGDLFDHQRVTGELVDRVLTRLAAIEPPCILLNGNHDLHDPGSLYRGRAEERSGMVFLDRHEGSTVELFDGALTVWGRAMDDHHRGFRPLHGVPDRPDGTGWWVVLGHGHHEPDEGGYRSSPVTPDDIEATGADYVALGHWHVRTDVSAGPVTAWYSGAPHGFGASGLWNLIDLDPDNGVRVEAAPVELPAAGCHPMPGLGSA
jgi:DNA repair exonuclease SbcCD nuclease subunit